MDKAQVRDLLGKLSPEDLKAILADVPVSVAQMVKDCANERATGWKAEISEYAHAMIGPTVPDLVEIALRGDGRLRVVITIGPEVTLEDKSVTGFSDFSEHFATSAMVDVYPGKSNPGGAKKPKEEPAPASPSTAH